MQQATTDLSALDLPEDDVAHAPRYVGDAELELEHIRIRDRRHKRTMSAAIVITLCLSVVLSITQATSVRKAEIAAELEIQTQSEEAQELAKELEETLDLLKRREQRSIEDALRGVSNYSREDYATAWIVGFLTIGVFVTAIGILKFLFRMIFR